MAKRQRCKGAVSQAGSSDSDEHSHRAEHTSPHRHLALVCYHVGWDSGGGTSDLLKLTLLPNHQVLVQHGQNLTEPHGHWNIDEATHAMELDTLAIFWHQRGISREAKGHRYHRIPNTSCWEEHQCDPRWQTILMPWKADWLFTFLLIYGCIAKQLCKLSSIMPFSRHSIL